MASTSSLDNRLEWNLSQFKLLGKPIYEGNHSKVYIANDLKSDAKVAIKCYKSKKIGSVERVQIERETSLHKPLRHENIIRLYGSFADKDYYYVVTELAAGTLFDKLKEKNRLHAQDVCLRFEEGDVALDVIKPLLEALGYLHAQGLIHRDIKPENILVSTDGILKLADFGLVIDAAAERPVSRLGTLDYMAPEVLQCPVKNHPNDHKDRVDLTYTSQVDCWAVGVLAYEMLVGKPPFEQGSRLDTEHFIMFEEPDMNVPWMSGHAKDFIKSALNKFPRSRHTIEKLKRHPWLKFAKKAVNSSIGGGLDPSLLYSSDEEDQPSSSSPSISAQASASSFSVQKVTKNTLLEVCKSSKSMSSLHAGSRPPSIVTMARQEILEAASPHSPSSPVHHTGSGGLPSPVSRRSASPSKLVPISTGGADLSPDNLLEEIHGFGRMKSANFDTSEKSTPNQGHSGEVLSAVRSGLSISKASSSRDLRAMAAAASHVARVSVEGDDERTSDTRHSPFSSVSHRQLLSSALHSVLDGPPAKEGALSSMPLGRRPRGSSNDGTSSGLRQHSSFCSPSSQPLGARSTRNSQDGSHKHSSVTSSNLPSLNSSPVNQRLNSAKSSRATMNLPSKSAGGSSPVDSPPLSRESTRSRFPLVPSLALDRRGSLSSINIPSPSAASTPPTGSQTSRFSSMASHQQVGPPLPRGDSYGGGVHSSMSSPQARSKILQSIKK